jgi:hypothetical protein
VLALDVVEQQADDSVHSVDATIEAGAEFGFLHFRQAPSFSRRGGARVLGFIPSLEESEGDGAPGGAGQAAEQKSLSTICYRRILNCEPNSKTWDIK